MSKGRHRKATRVEKTVAKAALLGVGATALPLTFMSGSAQASSLDSWEKVAECESGNRWNLSWGDRDSTGGLQFRVASWHDALAKLRAEGVDTSNYPSMPYQATKKQQIIAGEALLALQGPGAWTCNAMVGSPLGASMFEGGVNPYGNLDTKPEPKPEPKPEKDKPKPPVNKKPEKKSDEKSNKATYTVVSGDTLYDIAIAHGVGDGGLNTWKPLYNANKDVVEDPDLIYPGEVLHIPGGKPDKPVKADRKPEHRPEKKEEKKAEKPAKENKDFVAPLAKGTYRIGDGIINSGGCVSRSCGGHSGLDLSASAGTHVKAITAGVVVHAGYGGGGAAYGDHVIIKHDDGRFSLYGHMSSHTVREGERVKAGRWIGTVGSTGVSSGPHLHFEIRNQATAFNAGVFLNVIDYLRDNGVNL